MRKFLKLIVFLFFITISSTAIEAGAGNDAGKGLKDLQTVETILRNSKNTLQLEMAAIWLCHASGRRSESGKRALEILFDVLRDPNFLNRLDSDDNYKHYRHRLRVNRVLRAIGRNSTQAAEELLLKLAGNKAFNNNHVRVDCLINACALIRRPGPKLIKFLESLTSKGGYRNLAIIALVNIRSVEACNVVNKLVSSPKYSVLDKTSWLTTFLITARYDPEIVEIYEKVIRSKTNKEELKKLAVQALFDYLPREWYKPSHVGYPVPARLQNASSLVLKKLLQVADMSSQLNISSATKKRIKAAKNEINKILIQRQTPEKP